MTKKSPYREALEYLNGLIDYSKTHAENISPENFELERMLIFMEAFDNPHMAYPTIHIAGTKGKGSTAALTAAALTAAGYKTGLYTSPHLQDFAERIQVNTQPIPHDEIVTLIEELKPVAAAIPGITAYEVQTALAFLYFARQNVDAGVIEVGLGGRLDSTNIITPLVSVITAISLDHTFILGDTLKAIAKEKGGIIKPGVPIVCAPQSLEALTVLQSIAEENNSPVTLVGQDAHFEILQDSPDGLRLKLSVDETPGSLLETNVGLLGAHQAENAAAAYAALFITRAKGFYISHSHVQEGFSQVNWPGRFEIVNSDPPVILDGAHNRHSAHLLKAAVQKYFPDRPITLVFGASSDKDISGMFAELLPAAQDLVAVQSSHPRALAAQKLVEMTAAYSCQTHPISDIPEAIKHALTLANPNGLVLITGSIYMLGEARTAWFDS